MIPRLQAFYGGAPMAWLSMPVALLRAYVVMLPRLVAESSLRGLGVALVASGNMRKGDAQGLIGEWQRAADAGRSERPVLSEDERRDLYESSGFFDVEVVS